MGDWDSADIHDARNRIAKLEAKLTDGGVYIEAADHHRIVAKLEAKLEHERYLRDRDNTELIQYQKKLEAKLERVGTFLVALRKMWTGPEVQAWIDAALEGKQDGLSSDNPAQSPN